jgi:hypothetical protein
MIRSISQLEEQRHEKSEQLLAAFTEKTALHTRMEEIAARERRTADDLVSWKRCLFLNSDGRLLCASFSLLARFFLVWGRPKRRLKCSN